MERASFFLFAHETLISKTRAILENAGISTKTDGRAALNRSEV